MFQRQPNKYQGLQKGQQNEAIKSNFLHNLTTTSLGLLFKQKSPEDENKILQMIMKKQKHKLLVSNMDQRDCDDSQFS